MRILIAAGSSGGHIFPAVATAFKLRELDAKNEVFFVGSSKELDIRLFRNEGYNFDTLSSNRHIFKDLFRAFLILRRFKPDIAVGFGGYLSFPVLTMAKALGIPTVVHEQNLIPGLANKVLANIVNKIAVSFRETAGNLPLITKTKLSRVKETGNPIRVSLVRLDKNKMLETFCLDRWKFTILAMGGSQGAHFINDLMLDMLKDLDEAQRERLQVIHLSGLRDFEFVKSGYKALGVENRVFSFFDRMSEAYSAVDVVISRAGATSISEIIFFGLPAILIPYPNPKVHQVENARFLEKRGAAIVIEQGRVSKDYVKNIIIDLITNRDKLKLMSENSLKFSRPEAAHRLAEEILDVVKN